MLGVGAMIMTHRYENLLRRYSPLPWIESVVKAFVFKVMAVTFAIIDMASIVAGGVVFLLIIKVLRMCGFAPMQGGGAAS